MKTTFLLALLCVFLSIGAIGQEKTYVIKLVKKNQPEKVNYIYPGKRVKVFTESDKVYRGKIVIPDTRTIRVDAMTIPVDSIPKLRGNSTGLLITKIAGGVLGAAGIGVMIFGSIILYNGLNPDVWAELFLIPIGIVFAGSGAVATIAGGSVLFINGKKYDLRDKWDMSIVPAPESAE